MISAGGLYDSSVSPHHSLEWRLYVRTMVAEECRNSRTLVGTDPASRGTNCSTGRRGSPRSLHKSFTPQTESFQTEAEASTHRGFLHRWKCRGRETRGMRRCGAGAHTVALSYPVVRSALHECKASQHQDQYVLSCACREVSSEASELVLFS